MKSFLVWTQKNEVMQCAKKHFQADNCKFYSKFGVNFWIFVNAHKVFKNLQFWVWTEEKKEANGCKIGLKKKKRKKKWSIDRQLISTDMGVPSPRLMDTYDIALGILSLYQQNN